MNLSAYGFGFVKVKAHDKRPIGNGWQKIAYNADEARRHYQAGGNVGVHAGELSNGIIWIDVDQGRTLDQFLATFPSLASSLRVTRDNAPGRGKVAIRVTDRIPSPTKWKANPEDKSPSTELLSTGNQAVIWGTHPSGARYRLAGETVVEMTHADLSAIWQQWTGEPLTDNPAKRHKRQEAPQAPAYTPTDPDNLIERVKAAWSILAVFQHFGLASHGTEEARNGETRVLGNGGLLISKDGALWSIPANGRGFGGNVFDAWHWAKHQRLGDFHTDKGAFRDTLCEMAEAAGIEIPKSSGAVDPDEVRAEVAHLREWVKSTSFAEYVPTELQSSVGYRTDGTDTKIADALLDLAHTHGTRRLYVSRRKLAILAGIGNHETAQKALRRLHGWFVALHDDGMIELVARRSATSLSAPLVDDLVADLRATYSERKADDPFLTGVSRTAKDLGNEEGGLGETILRIVDALEAGGDMTRSELVDATGKTKSAIARGTLRAERLGLLCADQEHKKAPKVYSLNPDWAESVDNLTPSLKTYKLSAERRLKHYSEVIGDRVEAGKTAREDDQAALSAALVDLHGYSEDEAHRRVESYVATLNRLCLAPKPDAKHRRSGALAVAFEKRQERLAAAMLTLSMMEPGRLLWRDELARGRTAAGRLGVNFADYVESRPLQMAAD